MIKAIINLIIEIIEDMKISFNQIDQDLSDVFLVDSIYYIEKKEN